MRVDERRIISDYRLFLQVEKRLSVSTIELYVKATTHFLQFCQNFSEQLDLPEAFEWSDLGRREVERYLQQMQVQEHWKVSTCATRLIGLRSFFAYLAQQGDLPFNPIQHYTWTQPFPELEREEGDVTALHRLLEEPTRGFEQNRNRLLLELAYSCGWTSSQLSRMEKASLNQKKTGMVVVMGSESWEVPLGASGRKRLQQYLKQQKKFPETTDFWVNAWGSGLSDQAIRELLKEQLAPLGLGLRQLRELSAQAFQDRGADIRSVQQFRDVRYVRRLQSLKPENFEKLQGKFKKLHPRRSVPE